MHRDNTTDDKWCFVVYYRRHALWRVPQARAIGPGSIPAAGQRNPPPPITSVDHNGAAAARRPHQDAALMPFWGRRRDLTWERSLQTHAHAHPHPRAHIIHTHKLFFYSFGKHEQLDKSINVSNLHNSTLWLQPTSGS